MAWSMGLLGASLPSVATGAFDLLESKILTSSASSVTFTGLGSYSDYKHLQVRMVTRSDRASTVANIDFRLNGDSGSNYAWHTVQGNGSAVNVGAVSSTTLMRLAETTGSTEVSNNFAACVVDILDYANTSKNTTARSLSGRTGNSQIGLRSGLYNNTAAITSVTITPQGNFITGSRFSLYGIRG